MITGVTKTDIFNPANNAFTGLLGGTAGMAVDGTSGTNNITSLYYDAQGDHVTSNNDTVIGNAGVDTIAPGAGNDTIIWNRGDGADIVNETANGSDKNILQLVGVNAADV